MLVTKIAITALVIIKTVLKVRTVLKTMMHATEIVILRYMKKRIRETPSVILVLKKLSMLKKSLMRSLTANMKQHLIKNVEYRGCVYDSDYPVKNNLTVLNNRGSITDAKQYSTKGARERRSVFDKDN